MRFAALPQPPSRTKASTSEDARAARIRKRQFRGTKTEAIDPAPSSEDGILNLLEMRARYVEYVRQGVTPRNALKLLGVDQDAFEQLLRDRPDIRKEVEAAEVFVPAEAEMCFGRGAMEDPKVAKDYLERRQPKDWKPQMKIVHDVSSWSDDELEAFLARNGESLPERSSGESISAELPEGS